MSFYSHAQIPRYTGQGKKKTSGRKSGAKVTRASAGGHAACPERPPACGPPPGAGSPPGAGPPPGHWVPAGPGPACACLRSHMIKSWCHDTKSHPTLNYYPGENRTALVLKRVVDFTGRLPRCLKKKLKIFIFLLSGWSCTYS